MTFLTVLTPCYNEQGNVEPLYEKIKAIFAELPDYTYEHLFIDNASSDGTVATIKAIAARDPNVKLIVNVRNFGHIRSPFHGLLQARGEACIALASDFQDPPELIPEFLARWREGFPIVLGVKVTSDEPWLLYRIRSLYYELVGRMADVELVKHATGFGLYDRRVLEAFRATNDPYPYVRGLIAELGFPRATIPYRQPNRRWGITKNNFYTLYDMAMLGITSHSKVPLRIATMTGFVVAALSLLVALGYLVAKLVLWYNFPNIGQAPTVIGLFFFGGVQLVFTGILGEYIGAIHTQVLGRPRVIEKERVNFEPQPVPTGERVG